VLDIGAGEIGGLFAAGAGEAYLIGEAIGVSRDAEHDPNGVNDVENATSPSKVGVSLGEGEYTDSQGNVYNANGDLIRDKNGRDVGSKTPCPSKAVPPKAKAVADNAHSTGKPFPGYIGGRTFENDGRNGGQVLPRTDAQGNPISYQSWDVNPYQPGVNRGSERVVTGSDGSSYYTDDHYTTFTRIN
jgi:guanyl-specific ribonuclease Sa